jgi:hypothetical protein
MNLNFCHPAVLTLLLNTGGVDRPSYSGEPGFKSWPRTGYPVISFMERKIAGKRGGEKNMVHR